MFYSNLHSCFQQCDAIILATSYIYETVSLEAVKQWVSNIHKEVHILGPLLPPGYGTKIQSYEEGENIDIGTFLGEMLVRHGKRSVFFVRSFVPFFFWSLVSFLCLDFLWLYLLAYRFRIHRRVDRSPH